MSHSERYLPEFVVRLVVLPSMAMRQNFDVVRATMRTYKIDDAQCTTMWYAAVIAHHAKRSDDKVRVIVRGFDLYLHGHTFERRAIEPYLGGLLRDDESMVASADAICHHLRHVKHGVVAMLRDFLHDEADARRAA